MDATISASFQEGSDMLKCVTMIVGYLMLVSTAALAQTAHMRPQWSETAESSANVSVRFAGKQPKSRQSAYGQLRPLRLTWRNVRVGVSYCHSWCALRFASEH